MGLLSILKKIKSREKEMRVLVLGLDNAGKTTCVKALSGQRTDEISPTLGFNISTLLYNGFQLNIWDIGGQRSLRSYWVSRTALPFAPLLTHQQFQRNYFEQTDGLIWVVDCADLDRMLDCSRELHSLLQEERLAGASLLIFANKQDLDGALSLEEVAVALDLGRMEKRHCHIQPCSAFTGEGLEEGVQWLVSDVSARIFMLS